MKKILYLIGVFFLGTVILGVIQNSHTQYTVVSPDNGTVSSPDQTPNLKPTVEVKQETKDEVIPFTNTNINDQSLTKGQTKITQTGVNGTITRYYNVTYTDGQETNRVESKSTTTNPVNQITHIGTYVAPVAVTCLNGTYVNSVGNSVCSPYKAPSVPFGATAICRDGTYSFSQSRSGTCSHHGGVATWL